MEWLNEGQRVQKYAIEIWTGSGVEERGLGAGHWAQENRQLSACRASRVRLNILSSTDAASIREFQLYEVEGLEAEAAAKER